jgi:multiple sugar transport system permease protein
MTSSDKMRTVALGLNIMRQTSEGGTNWHVVMAGTVLALLPVLLLFLFFQRYFIEGISRSGLKGV